MTYVDKEKAQEFLFHQSAPIAATAANPELVSAAKIVENFENPIMNTGKSNEEDGKLYRSTIEQPGAGSARDEYNRTVREPNKSGSVGRMDNLLWRLDKAYGDSMKALKAFTDAVLNETGNTMSSHEDAYKAENALSSKNKTQQEAWERDYFHPIKELVFKLQEKGASTYGDLKMYVVAKHGLERNEVLAQRDFDAYKNEHSKGKKTLDDFRKKDYSGLTALTGEDDVADAELVARDLVKAYEQQHGQALINKWWNAINAATKSSLKKRYDSGLLSKEGYAHIRDMFKYYVPLKGWDSNVASEEFNYMSNSRGHVGSPKMITAKGRRSLADDPIATIGSDGCSAIVQGNRNVMKRHFLNFVVNNPTSLASIGRQWYVKDATGEWMPKEPAIPTDADGDEIARIVAHHEADMEQLRQLGKAAYKRDHLKLGLNTTMAEQGEHKVKVLIGGVERVIYINGNPMAAQAVNGTTNPDVHVGKTEAMLKKAQSGYAGVLTSKNPAFVLANLSMDTIQAMTYTAIREDGAYNRQAMSNALMVFSKGLMPQLIYKWQHGTLDFNNEVERYFNEFMTNGGETGFTQLHTVARVKKDIERFVKEAEGGVAGIPKKAWRGLWDGVEFMNRSAEDTNRFICYMTSRQMGRDVARSIWDAKDITVNFNKKGDGGMGARKLRWAYVFFNAAIQSARTLGRVVAANPKRAAAVIGSFASAGFVVPMLNMFIAGLLGSGDGDDDPMQWYWDLPKWQRRNNLIMFMPFTKGKYFMLPLPHELRSFYGLGECAFTAYTGKQSVGEALGDAAQNFSTMLPLDFTGNGGNAVLNVVPSLGLPIAQVIANEDYFGKPVYRRSDYTKLDPEWTKAYKGTGAIAIGLSKFINSIGNDAPEIHKQPWDGWWSNPDVMEHVVGSYFGGMGKTVMQTAKTVGALWNGEQPELRNVPVVSRFITAVDERSSGSDVNSRYHEAMDEFKKTEHDYSGYKKGKSMGVMEYAEKLDKFMQSDEFKRYRKMRGYRKSILHLQKNLKHAQEKGRDTESVEKAIQNAKHEMVEELSKLDK